MTMMLCYSLTKISVRKLLHPVQTSSADREWQYTPGRGSYRLIFVLLQNLARVAWKERKLQRLSRKNGVKGKRRGRYFCSFLKIAWGQWLNIARKSLDFAKWCGTSKNLRNGICFKEEFQVLF